MIARLARWCFRAWLALWAGTLLLVFTQGFFMARQWWMLVAGGVAASAIAWLGLHWDRGLTRKGLVACNVLRIIAVLHLLPALLQLLQLGAPRWDNLLLMLIGWGLFEAAGWPVGARSSAQEHAGRA